MMLFSLTDSGNFKTNKQTKNKKTPTKNQHPPNNNNKTTQKTSPHNPIFFLI